MKQGKKSRSMHAAAPGQKPRMGRPPKEEAVLLKPFMLRLPPDLMAAVDVVASGLPDRQERSVAIRMLLREALAARGRKGK